MINEEILTSIKDFSIKGYNLNETTSADVASQPNIISTLIEEKYNDSLAYNICEVDPIQTSLGQSFASVRKDNKFIVLKKDIHVKLYTVNTGYTLEVWDDMNRMFGKNASKTSGKLLSGFSSNDENFTLITLINAQALIKPPLLIDKGDSGWIIDQIAHRVAESVIEMNRHSFKTLESFCILSGTWAASFLSELDTKKDGLKNSLFVGRHGSTDYYVNPFPNTASEFNNDYDYSFEIEDSSVPDYCYVGLKSDVKGESSLIFTPYTYEMNIVVDPDTGDNTVFVYNRFGLDSTPLHLPLENKSILHKFELNKV